jgi:hypothetical protein
MLPPGRDTIYIEENTSHLAENSVAWSHEHSRCPGLHHGFEKRSPVYGLRGIYRQSDRALFLVLTSALHRRGHHPTAACPTLVRPANTLFILYMRVYQSNFRRRRHKDINVYT